MRNLLKEYHDYDAGWDYEIDEDVDTSLVSMTNRIKKDIEKNLLWWEERKVLPAFARKKENTKARR